LSLESLDPARATAASADRFSVFFDRLRRRFAGPIFIGPERSNQAA